MQTLPKREVMLQNRVRGQVFFFFSVFFGDGAKLKVIASYYLPGASRSIIITAGCCKICTCISVVEDSEISLCFFFVALIIKNIS